MTDRKVKFSFAVGAAILFSSIPLVAQRARVSLHGQVTDPSGAAIPGATVRVIGPHKTTAQTQTNQEGKYTFSDLTPGAYTIEIGAANFTTLRETGVVVAGKAQVVNAQLAIHAEKQQVTVQSETGKVSLSPQHNASALVLTGSALKALSNDPDELQQELEALAGPAAGPNGAQIYIDGFQGGDLPPKEDILEVKVNQNPFTAEHAELGYGRIEIITKPGYQKFHGSAFTFGNDSILNSRNPFAPQEPNYHSYMFNGNVGGPLGKKASFFMDLFHRTLDNVSVINAEQVVPSGPTTFALAPITQALSSPQNMTGLFSRVDLQLGQKNVLSIMPHYFQNTAANQGIGQFDLQEQAYDSGHHSEGVHALDTAVLSAMAVNSLRIGIEHQNNSQTPYNTGPEVNIPNYFVTGGNSQGLYSESQNHFEAEDTLDLTHGRNSFVFGGMLQNVNESLSNSAGFNGGYTFASLGAYLATLQGVAQGLTASQILAAGGGASQFTLTAGNPRASADLLNAAFYAEDTRRVRPNFSLTLGLRFETQNHISDHADFAPRLSLAWGIGHGAAPKTVLRAGFGLFYDRFGMSNILQAEQLNGINEQRYVVYQPGFFPPTVPAASSLTTAASFPALYQIDSNLRAPYVAESAIGLDRQIARNIKASVTYVNSHGVHQIQTRDINAPLPGTYVPCTVLSPQPCTPSPGIRPFGNIGNVYQYESGGIYNENQLIVNFSVLAGARLTLFGYYSLSYANGDAGFIMNPYDISQSYGTASFVVRNHSLLGGTFGLPYGFQLSPFLFITSGNPYNVTLGGIDLFGTGSFDARPALAAPGATGPNIISTKLGVFNIAPGPGVALIPVNSFVGPSQVSLNARFSKTFYFGKEGGVSGGPGWHGRSSGLGGRGLGSQGPSFFHHGGENRRYSLEVGLMVHNVFNHVNLATPDGTLTPVPSPFFGVSNSLGGGFFGAGEGANRSVNLIVHFNF